MVAPADVIAPKVTSAIAAAYGDDFREADPVLRPSQFADLQVNAALALAKRVGQPPREVAAKIVENLDLSDECAAIEISGPGFINLTFASSWIDALVDHLGDDERLGVATQPPLNIPLDYSSPNVAKEMHVGHLRPTILGDALARTLEHLGHHVIRQNHVGDWGTPFGMLIEHLLDVGEGSSEAGLLESDPNAFYQQARVKFDSDEEFATRSRTRVVKLQAHDPDTLTHWRTLIDLSTAYFNKVYGALGVTLTDEDLAGESSYNDELEGICRELEEAGIATMSDGALCVFLDGYTGREGKPVPLIVRKSDGGYGYGTTDLATIRHRVNDLHANRCLYVVGVTQSLHLSMVWDVARKAGWLPDQVEVVHVKVGSVLGADRKILKTRSGAPMRLMALVEEAIDKARAHIDDARPDLDPDVRAEIGAQIGVGAIKYADLSVAHDSEYVFDLDRMLSLTGNTGPYLQYAATRIKSIFASIDLDPATMAAPVHVGEQVERALALHLLEFATVVTAVGDALEPHRLCGYLFELAQAFSAFYENCPVLKAESEEVRASRLTLCALTLRVLVHGLDLIGIESPDQM